MGWTNSESGRCVFMFWGSKEWGCVWDVCRLSILVLWIMGRVCDTSTLQFQRCFLNVFTVGKLYFYCKNIKKNIFYKNCITHNPEPYFKVYKCKSNFLFHLCLWGWPQGAVTCKIIHHI
jgi:hypothetical protein